MRNVIFMSRKQYIIGYRYYNKGGFIWNAFNSLSEVNTTYKSVLKNCKQFRLFKYDSVNDKYKTIFSKQRLLNLTTKKLVVSIAESSQSLYIINGIKEFSNKIGLSLNKKTH